MDKNHLVHQSHLLAQQGSSETNSMLLSAEDTITAAWPSESQLNHPYALTDSCNSHNNMPTNGVVNFPDSEMNRSQPSATLQPVPCFDIMSDPSTMGCSVQFDETRPAPYGSTAVPSSLVTMKFSVCQ